MLHIIGIFKFKWELLLVKVDRPTVRTFKWIFPILTIQMSSLAILMKYFSWWCGLVTTITWWIIIIGLYYFIRHYIMIYGITSFIMLCTRHYFPFLKRLKLFYLPLKLSKCLFRDSIKKTYSTLLLLRLTAVKGIQWVEFIIKEN